MTTTVKRNKTANLDKAIQAEIDKLVAEVEKVDQLDHTIESASEAIEELRWTTAERCRHIVRDGKVAANTLAAEIDKTPAWVRQAVGVAELYGEDDYRLPERTYNDHLELSKLKAEDRDAVVKYADEYGTSIKTARVKVKALQAKKVAKAEASDEEGEGKAKSASTSSSKTRPKLSGKGGIETLNKELRRFVSDVSELSSLITTAIRQGARLDAKEAKELEAIAEAIAEAAGASQAPAPATEVAAPQASPKVKANPATKAATKATKAEAAKPAASKPRVVRKAA
jgi:hypothetical protein